MQQNNNSNATVSTAGEIEIMEFTVDGQLYGINVAKVREIMLSREVRPMPHSHEAVEGIFKPRDFLITVVDLPCYLRGQVQERGEKDLFIVTNFNRTYIAFRVHTVEGIRRMSWEEVEKPGEAVSGGSVGMATGVAQSDDRLVTILDLERIVADISPQTSISLSDITNLGQRDNNNASIWLAEDSMFLSQTICSALKNAGYINVTTFSNGKELWNKLKECRDGGNINQCAQVVVTDLEMPQMDGHQLLKSIKADAILKQVKVVVFSALITEEMWKIGQQLGADGQLSKPEIAKLVEMLDDLLSNSHESRAGGEAI